jgi:hypothetical protein
MRRAAAALILLSAVSVGASWPAGQVGDGARIQEWIEQLGRPKYADREKASQQLAAIGLPALPPLRAAAKSSDMEVRRRAELLVKKLENQQRTATLLAPKRVHLNVEDVTVAEAVAQLAALSGYPIQLQGNPSIMAARRVTLDTGDSTFWEAARQLCDKAGLVDTAAAAKTTYNARIGAVAKGGAQKLTRPNLGGGLQWTVGDPALRPTCSTGSVRIQVIDKSISPKGEIDLVLEVTGEPRLADFGALGTAAIDKALDEHGQVLNGTAGAPRLDRDDMEGKVLAKVLIVNGNNVMVGGPTSSRVIEFRLLPGAKKATRLQELKGKLTVQALVETEPLIVIDKILEAAGKSGSGKDDAALTIQNVVKMPNGDIRIVVVMENLPGLVHLFPGGANLRLEARVGNDTTSTPASHPRLIDAAGKSFTLVQASTPKLMINANKVSVTADLLYRPQAGQGPAAQLVVPGQSHFVFEVPFTLKDIRLP